MAHVLQYCWLPLARSMCVCLCFLFLFISNDKEYSTASYVNYYAYIHILRGIETTLFGNAIVVVSFFVNHQESVHVNRIGLLSTCSMSKETFSSFSLSHHIGVFCFHLGAHKTCTKIISTNLLLREIKTNLTVEDEATRAQQKKNYMKR